jgi:hypothetical protein
MKTYLLLLFSLFIIFSCFDRGVVAQPTGPQEYVPLTLVQIIGRSDAAVHVRVSDGSGKFAIVEVLETLSGPDPGKRLRIDFRDLNLSLKGREAMVFEKEEEDILFLHRPDWKKPSAKNADVFELLHGRRGRLLLPPEGSGIYLEAVRRLGAIVRQDPSDQVESLRRFLGSENPFLREAALAEVGRLGALTVVDLPALIHLIADPSAGLREKSLDQIRVVLHAANGDEGDGGEDPRRALEAARERARNDPDEKVRAAAVRTMSAWKHHEDVVPDLKAIAGIDPSQLVRYEAQRVLFLWGGIQAPAPGSP